MANVDCPRCGVLNAAENKTCSNCGTGLQAAGGPTAAKPAGRVFRDPKRLTQWLRWLLIASIVAYVVGGAAELAQLQVLQAIQDGSFSSEEEMMSAAQASDLRQTVVSIGALVIIIGTIVMFAVWVHRMNSNIHAFGATNLRFTPGWAVGWYFVPIANLWKPYQVMSEIWRASKNPVGWQSEPAGGLLGWWWFWWLASNFADNISMRMSWRAEELEELISVVPVNIVSSALDIVSAVLALLVVRRIGGFQAEAADKSLSAVFA